MNDIINWLDSDDKCKESLNYNAMEKYGNYVQVQKNEDIISLPELRTFDAHVETLNMLEICIGNIHGNVVDLGAGLGVFSAALSRLNINKLYSLDYSFSLLNNAFPKTFELLKNKLKKANPSLIQRICCNFNSLNFENDSIDLIFANFALHHSNTPVKTLIESYRMLRSDGKMIVIERSLPNDFSDDYIEKKKKQKLNEQQNNRYGIEAGKTISREEIGEHDWREKEWLDFFSKSGFKVKLKLEVKERNRKRFIHAILWRIAKAVNKPKVFLLKNHKEISLYPSFYDGGFSIFVLEKNCERI